MSQKLIISILGLVIVVGGGVWYYQTNMSDTSNVSSSKSSEREESSEKSGGILDSLKKGVGNFADVLDSGDTLECRLSGIDPETKEQIKGTMFIAGENFRLDADTTVEGKPTVVHMIQNEKVMHMWFEEEGEATGGFIIDATMFEGMEGEEAPQSPLDLLKDPESGIEYDCKGWSPKKNSFEPPEDVQFIDMFGEMGNMFEGMMQEGMMGGEGMMGEGDSAGDDWSY